MNYKSEIEQLEKQLSSLKEKQRSSESNCEHLWGETKYDPKKVLEAVFSHYEPHGSDLEPIYNYYPKKKDRWSRTCSLCGRVEYTQEQIPVKYEPKFR